MIVTVTMNPAIDKTARIEEFIYGKLNRIDSTSVDVGGKGINVSKVIYNLGGETIATGFIGGNNGVVIEKDLKYRGIKVDFVIVNQETRTNLKLIDETGKVTELNEIGPTISDKQIEILTDKIVSLAKEDTLFVLTGSIPNGLEPTIYRDIIFKIQEKKAKVFLDADGDAFAFGLEAKPDIIKPNRYELQKYFKVEGDSTKEELIDMGKKLQNKGIDIVIISLGEEGVLFFVHQSVFEVPGINVEVKSPVGAGDALVGAYVWGLDKGLPMEEIIKTAVAASAGAVTTVGTKPPMKEVIEALKKEVTIKKLQ